MNKPNRREGFVNDAEPTVDEATIPEAASAPEPEHPRVDEFPITVKLLHRPVRNNKGEEVREVVFREPTGGDINRYGNPVRVNQDGAILSAKRVVEAVQAGELPARAAAAAVHSNGTPRPVASA